LTHRACFSPASTLDFVPRRELEQLQLDRLQTVVALSYEKVPLYRSRMKERGVAPEDILSLADIAKLPFTVKTDLRDTYPFGLFAAPMKDGYHAGRFSP